MTRYLEAVPSTKAYTTTPMTPEEIDVQPNADAIWATILAIRLEAQSAARDAYDRGFQDGRSSNTYP
jgi:hypothetical protein